MAVLRARGATASQRGPGRALVGMAALLCLTGSYLLGKSSLWADANTRLMDAGTAAVLKTHQVQVAEGDGGSGGSSIPDASASASAAASARARVKTVCEDSCPGQAKNGVCNDGRPTPDKDQTDSMTIFEVLCDLGTDCSDCGPWVRAPHAAQAAP